MQEAEFRLEGLKSSKKIKDVRIKNLCTASLLVHLSTKYARKMRSVRMTCTKNLKEQR